MILDDGHDFIDL